MALNAITQVRSVATMKNSSKGTQRSNVVGLLTLSWLPEVFVAQKALILLYLVEFAVVQPIQSFRVTKSVVRGKSDWVIHVVDPLRILRVPRSIRFVAMMFYLSLPQVPSVAGPS